MVIFLSFHYVICSSKQKEISSYLFAPVLDHSSVDKCSLVLAKFLHLFLPVEKKYQVIYLRLSWITAVLTNAVWSLLNSSICSFQSAAPVLFQLLSTALKFPPPPPPPLFRGAGRASSCSLVIMERETRPASVSTVLMRILTLSPMATTSLTELVLPSARAEM